MANNEIINARGSKELKKALKAVARKNKTTGSKYLRDLLLKDKQIKNELAAHS